MTAPARLASPFVKHAAKMLHTSARSVSSSGAKRMNAHREHARKYTSVHPSPPTSAASSARSGDCATMPKSGAEGSRARGSASRSTLSCFFRILRAAMWLSVAKLRRRPRLACSSISSARTRDLVIAAGGAAAALAASSGSRAGGLWRSVTAARTVASRAHSASSCATKNSSALATSPSSATKKLSSAAIIPSWKAYEAAATRVRSVSAQTATRRPSPSTTALGSEEDAISSTWIRPALEECAKRRSLSLSLSAGATSSPSSRPLRGWVSCVPSSTSSSTSCPPPRSSSSESSDASSPQMSDIAVAPARTLFKSFFSNL